MDIKKLLIPFIIIISLVFFSKDLYAACGVTTRTWDAGGTNNRWNQAANWSANNIPNTTTENALIVSGARPCRANLTTSISCLEVTSGEFRTNNNRTLTIIGDYFRAPNSNSIVSVVAHTNFWIVMGGTGTQSFEVQDPINNLRISNNTTVNLTNPFEIRNQLDITGTTTNINVQDDLIMAIGSTSLSIPAGVTMTLESGVVLTANEGITVNGTLKIESGASLILGNGETLSVPSGGRLELNGSSGSTATITSTGSGNSYTFTAAGTIDANYFRIDRMVAAGLNVTGTIAQLQNGEFHNIANNGYAITLGAAAVVPSSMDNLGFFDDDGHGNTQNIDASAYNVSNTNLDNFSGSIGGEANDNDPNNRIDWGTAAGTKLTVSNNTASGFPPTTINQSSADTLFATFAFALTAVDTTTDITAVTLTMSGTANSADLASAKVFRDVGGGTNCVYDAGTDAQVGSDLTFSGSPPTTAVSFGAGDVQTSSDTDLACFHVLLATSATAQDAKTLKISVESTSDVTNDQSYSFSDTAGPPVSAGTSTINGGTVWEWQGDGADQNWNRNANWRRSGFPNSGRDCEVGIGTQTTLMNITNGACQNTELQSGGTIDFANAARTLDVYGSLTVEASYNFVNAGSSSIRMMGANNQSVVASTNLPNNFVINNTGAAGNDIISLDSNLTVSNDVTITDGTLLVTGGSTLTVLGNLTVQTGAELEIEPGGTLAFANGSVLTVDSGGTLTLVGTSGLNAAITSTSTANAYTVAVNGTIEARYYSFSRLGTTGVTIGATATINATNHLQDGNYSYPVNNSSTLLNLDIQVPTNSMDNTVFSLGGSSATGTTNIDTTGAPAGTLNIANYSGDVSGPTFDTDPTYLISWSNALNNIHLTQEATSPASVDAGSTYIMGRFGFEQEQAGASFSDTDVTQMKVTLTGTGDSFDVSDVRIYYDSDCNNSGGTQIGSGAPSGTPASVTFSISASSATVESDAVNPPLRCIYVEYAMDAEARDGKTIGAKIDISTDITNDQSYPFSATTTFPVTLGTPATINGSTLTRWTGATNTDWHTAGNWTNGVPTSSNNCIIDNAANDPIINGGSGVASCNSIQIGSGVVTLQNATGAILEFFGNFTNTGTINYNDGDLRASDTISSSDQTITTSSTIDSLTFAKTLGGSLTLGGTATTINTLTFPGGSNFDFRVPAGKTLILPNGVSVAAATLDVQGGGELQIGNGQTLTVNGGTFRTSGTNDAYPQSTGNKGTVTVQSSGTWNFNATSGTVDLTGFILDYLSTTGVVIGVGATLSNLNGGQLTNLSNSYASVVGFQFNSSNIPATANNIGWNWGPNNTPPATSAAYTLAASTGCGSNTITFDQWFGDFFVNAGDPDTTTKISATNCTINITAAASPVNLLSLSATPYNEAIRLYWKTGLETDHAGFNVYRSRHRFHGYSQINNELVRNNLNSTHFHGSYQFDDKNIDNSVTYYYMIEDIAFNNDRKLHGPVLVTPEAIFGSLPSNDSNQNHDSTEDGDQSAPHGGGLQNEGGQELAKGIKILSQTQSSIVIEIKPSPLQWNTSPLNNNYDQASIEGYNKSSNKGLPEWLERTLLIPVESDWNQATLLSTEVLFHANITHKKLAAAPNYILNSNDQLAPHWSLDSNSYALDQNFPEKNFVVEPQLLDLQGQKFLRVHIYPLRYNPVQQITQAVQSARLFIDLDSSGSASPSHNLSIPVSATEDVLRISFNKTGMYELSYQDLMSLNLEWFLNDEDPQDFRLYYRNEEISLEINDTDNLWNNGDSVSFFLDYAPSSEDNNSYVYLSNKDLLDSALTPLRMISVNGDPSGHGSSYLPKTRSSVHLEENKKLVLDTPMGSDVDHYFWKRIYSQQGQAPGTAAFFDFKADLENIDTNDMVDVYVTLHSRSTDSRNAPQKLGLWINNYGDRVDTLPYPARQVHTLRFQVPGHYFISGLNNIRLEAISEDLNPGEYILTDIDRVRLDYMKDASAINDKTFVYSPAQSESIKLNHFTSSDIHIYDVSSLNEIAKYQNFSIYSESSGHSADIAFDHSFSEDAGYRLLALEKNQFLSPQGIQIQKGYSQSSLHTEGFQMVMIGPQHLKNRIRLLVSHRQSQGLSTHFFSYQQIYDEWNHGVKSSKSIKDFLNWAKSSWQQSPQYILFFGDSTQDPKNYLGNSLPYEAQPYPFIKGTHLDFGSDNYFVTSENSSIPFAAVGRVPSNDPQTVSLYIQKVIDYESGIRAPLNARQVTLISDKSPMNENFSQQGDQLLSEQSVKQPEFLFSHHKLDGSDENLLKNKIKNDIFPQGPLIVNFLGHGAEDRWSDSLFLNTDAKSLDNSALPIVSALNCLNAYFFDPDPTYESLGESFLFNEKGGAVAFWGSSAMTVPSTQIQLSNNLQQRLYDSVKHKDSRNLRLGDIMVQAKAQLGDREFAKDTVNSWVLFGDPALQIPDSTYIEKNETSNQPAQQIPTSGGGCSAFASEGSSESRAVGLELIFLLLPLAFNLYFQRRTRLRQKVKIGS